MHDGSSRDHIFIDDWRLRTHLDTDSLTLLTFESTLAMLAFLFVPVKQVKHAEKCYDGELQRQSFCSRRFRPRTTASSFSGPIEATAAIRGAERCGHAPGALQPIDIPDSEIPRYPRSKRERPVVEICMRQAPANDDRPR